MQHLIWTTWICLCILIKEGGSHYGNLLHFTRPEGVTKLQFYEEGEEKAILECESGLFLTLGLGTSSARNENIRPLLNRNIPLISGKYGLKNHF